MRRARSAFLVPVMAMAFGAAGPPAAFAEPEFDYESPVTGSGGEFLLRADGGAIVIKCESTSSKAQSQGGYSVNEEVILFHGCKSSGEEKANCTVKSTTAPAAGLIQTWSLKGRLGLTLPKGIRETGVGLLTLSVPVYERITTIEGNACTPETNVTGSVAAEVAPIGTKTKRPILRFIVIGGKQLFKAIDLTHGGLAAPQLEAFGTEATAEFTDLLEYSNELEVT